MVSYWLKRPGHEVILEFMDAKGTLIKSFTSKQDSATAADSVARASRGADARSATPALAADEDGPIRAAAAPRVPNRSGINSFSWNMRYPDASTFDGLIMWAGGVQGPVAPPGTYQVRMIVDGKAVATERLTLKKDPRSGATQADLDAQFAFLLQLATGI